MDNYILQILKIIPYWLSGIALGALLRTCQSDAVSRILLKLSSRNNIVLPLIIASALGAVSPVTLFGIIPILYIFDIKQNRKMEAILMAFISTSILISPNIFIFTISLGLEIAFIRLFSSISTGVVSGVLIYYFSKPDEPFLELDIKTTENKPEEISGEKEVRLIQFRKIFYGAFKKTGINLLFGVGISFIIYALIPDSLWNLTFSGNSSAVPVSAFLSIGLYQCGGGSIPILQGLMREGLSAGGAITFMMIGPLTKMTNLTALKSILSLKKLILYCTILILYMMLIGWSLG